MARAKKTTKKNAKSKPKKNSSKKKTSSRAPKFKVVNPDDLRIANPSDDEMVVMYPEDDPVMYPTNAGYADHLDGILIGKLEFAILSFNRDKGYASLEVYDAKTGNKVGEAYTDDPDELDDLVKDMMDESKKENPAKHAKKLHPYAMGKKTYKPKKRNAKKKR